MSEQDLIDAVADRAQYDDSFRNSLNRAISTRDQSWIMRLIQLVVRDILGEVTRWMLDRVRDWFFGS